LDTLPRKTIIQNRWSKKNLPLQAETKTICDHQATTAKANKTMSGQAIPNHRRRKDKESEGNTDIAAHNQTLKQQTQLHDRNCHTPININTECQRTLLPHQKTPFGKLD
jgi:hypothetical protein